MYIDLAGAWHTVSFSFKKSKINFSLLDSWPQYLMQVICENKKRYATYAVWKRW